MTDATYQNVCALINKHYWEPKGGFTESTRIAEDLGIDGIDGLELVQLVATEFDMRLSDFDHLDYFAPEGCNPFAMLLWRWRDKMSARWIEVFQFDLYREKTSLTIRHICNCVDAGQWLNIPQTKPIKTKKPNKSEMATPRKPSD